MYSRGGTTAAKPDMTLRFYANDLFHTTNLANVKLLGEENLAIGDWDARGTGVAKLWYAHVGGLDIPYYDRDNTGEFHVEVENNASTSSLTAKLLLEFGFRPELGA